MKKYDFFDWVAETHFGEGPENAKNPICFQSGTQVALWRTLQKLSGSLRALPQVFALREEKFFFENMHFLRFSFCNFCTRSSLRGSLRSLTARFIEDSRTWNTKKLNLCGGFSLPISAWRRLQVVVLNSRALLAPHGTTWHHMPRALGYVSHVSQVCFNSPFCKHSKRIHKSELFGGAILFWHPWFLVRPTVSPI